MCIIVNKDKFYSLSDELITTLTLDLNPLRLACPDYHCSDCHQATDFATGLQAEAKVVIVPKLHLLVTVNLLLAMAKHLLVKVVVTTLRVIIIDQREGLATVELQLVAVTDLLLVN